MTYPKSLLVLWMILIPCSYNSLRAQLTTDLHRYSFPRALRIVKNRNSISLIIVWHISSRQFLNYFICFDVLNLYFKYNDDLIRKHIYPAYILLSHSCFDEIAHGQILIRFRFQSTSATSATVFFLKLRTLDEVSKTHICLFNPPFNLRNKIVASDFDNIKYKYKNRINIKIDINRNYLNFV